MKRIAGLVVLLITVATLMSACQQSTPVSAPAQEQAVTNSVQQ